MRLLPAVSLLALVISTVVALMQGAELATIHSSIQQASALVPDYGSLMAWRVVLLTAALCAGLPLSLKVTRLRYRCCHWPLCWCWQGS